MELTRCLQSLASESSEIHEIIVADDGSTDDTAAVAAADGCIVVRFPVSRGICAARNAGAAQATGEILAFVDDDTEIVPGWGAALRQAFADGSALVGGRIIAPPPRTLAAWYRGLSEPHDIAARNGFLPFICGANFAIRTEVFRRMGGFDEDLPSSEDLDLSFRVQLAGYRVSYSSDAALVHWPRSSMTAYLRQRAHHVHGDGVVRHKYREFPFQRAKLWRRSAARVLVVQTATQLMTGLRGERHRLVYPMISSVAVAAAWLGVLKGDLELLTRRRPRPKLVPSLNEQQRQTATELPGGPSVLLLGGDRLLARLLRLTFEGGFDLALAPHGLAQQALDEWDESAPPYPDLARMARRAGWLAPFDILLDRLTRERPGTWGEAFCVLHATQAWLLRRPRFGLIALGEAAAPMAKRFPEVPVVALGRSPVPGRVIFRVTRTALLRNRIQLMADLRRALRDQAPPLATPATPPAPAAPPPASAEDRPVTLTREG